MNNIETYLNLNITYKDFYINNNQAFENTSPTLEKIFIEVCLDVDIIFSSLNIPPSKTGCNFWKDAIFLYLISEQKNIKICNDIYPYIAKKYSTNKMCVDRAMRRCFENVLYFANKHESNYVCSYLKNTILYPHNSEIIVKIVELISSKNFQQNKLKFAV